MRQWRTYVATAGRVDVTSRTALVVTTVVLAVVLAVLVAVLTPWRPLPLHGVAPVPVDPCA